MSNLLQTKYRYHVFFVGVFLMTISGFLYKYSILSADLAAASVVLGFLIFVASIAIP